MLLFSAIPTENPGLIFISPSTGATENGRVVSTVEAYNPVTGELTPLACMKNSRSNMGIAVLHDYIYVVGGIGLRSPYMTAVERYSIKEVSFE